MEPATEPSIVTSSAPSRGQTRPGVLLPSLLRGYGEPGYGLIRRTLGGMAAFVILMRGNHVVNRSTPTDFRAILAADSGRPSRCPKGTAGRR